MWRRLLNSSTKGACEDCEICPHNSGWWKTSGDVVIMLNHKGRKHRKEGKLLL